MKYVVAMAGYTGDLDLMQRHNEGLKPPFALSEVMDGKVEALLTEIYEPDLVEFGYEPVA